MHHSRRWALAAIGMAAVCGLVTTGCADRNSGVRGAMRGRVQLDGRPLDTGRIEFTPTAGTTGPIAGGEILNGGFDIPTARGPAIGTNLVRVSAPKPSGRKVPGPFGTPIDEIVETVPDRYNTASTLQVEIKKGRNELNLDLHSKPE
jgi:hypothetical protein